MKDKLFQYMEKWNRKQKILLAGGIVLLVLCVVCFSAFHVLRAVGKNNLYHSADSKKPHLGIEASASDAGETQEVMIDPENMGNVADLEETSEVQTSGEAVAETTEGNENRSHPEQESSRSEENQKSEEETSLTWIESEENEDGQLILENRNPQETPSAGTIRPAPEGASYDLIYQGTKYVYNKDILTLLVLGIDKRTTVRPAKDGISGGQSDAMFLLVLNPHTGTIRILAIPRDTIAKIDIYDRSGTFVQSGYAQICLQHGYGDGMTVSNERAKKAVSTLFYDLPIHSVTSIHMGAIPGINDAIGGITLESLYTFQDEGWSFVQGETVHLEGIGAYSYIRYIETLYRTGTAGTPETVHQPVYGKGIAGNREKCFHHRRHLFVCSGLCRHRSWNQ